MDNKKNTFQEFCKTIATLRSENGCPWDKKQTVHTLKKYIREESEELLEALDTNDPSHICEESGDILFLLVLLAEINQENGFYTMEDVISGINEKMIRRHPHVFAGAPTGSERELTEQWKKIKSQE